MHDAAYKLLYSHRRMVADLLRGFLPGGVRLDFDFNTLKPLPASHVGRELQRREGDRMWRLRARAAPDGGWVHVLLLEFQSRVDRRMASRGLTDTGLAYINAEVIFPSCWSEWGVLLRQRHGYRLAKWAKARFIHAGKSSVHSNLVRLTNYGPLVAASSPQTVMIT